MSPIRRSSVANRLTANTLGEFQRSRTSDRAEVACRALSPEVARVSIRRKAVGSEATGPKTAGSHRSVATSARQSPTQCDRQSAVQEDLAGIVDGPQLPLRRQSCGYRLVKTRLADPLQHQDRAGLRDHLPTVSPDTDTWVRRDRLSHLESAFFPAANRTLSKSYRCRLRALSVSLINSLDSPPRESARQTAGNTECPVFPTGCPTRCHFLVLSRSWHRCPAPARKSAILCPWCVGPCTRPLALLCVASSARN